MPPSGPERRVSPLRNAVYLAAGVALHLLLLLAFLRAWRPPPPAVVFEATQVGLVRGAAGPIAAAATPPASTPSPTAPPPPPPTLPAPNDPAPAPAELDTPQPATPPPDTPATSPQPVATGSGPQAQGSAGDEGGCTIEDDLKRALQATPAARSAIDAIPDAARSVANAVMVWDGDWAAPRSLGPAGLPIRAVAIETIASGRPVCRDATVRGPRLIIVGDGRRPVTLVFGSGVWRWSDVLRPGSRPESAAPASRPKADRGEKSK